MITGVNTLITKYRASRYQVTLIARKPIRSVEEISTWNTVRSNNGLLKIGLHVLVLRD